MTPVLFLALAATHAQPPAGPERPLTEILLPEDPPTEDPVLRWNEAALLTIKAEKTPPPLAARHLAMMHVAAFDAANAVQRTHHHFEVDPPRGFRGASPEAAAAAAAHHVLAGLYPARAKQFDALLKRTVERLGESPAVDRGLALGRYVGKEVLSWRAEDGADKETRFAGGSEPGEWSPTPPAFAKPLAPHWPKVTCFALRRGFQFRSDGPPKLTDRAYTEAFDEVKKLGARDSTGRTRDQTEIALFWADGEGTVTPPGHWNRIAQGVARRKKLPLIESARLFALMNVAMADVGIGCWDCKYHFHFWRPIQGIREADRDGNPDTAPDPDWEPLLATPPFPSYTSGHSSFSGAAATVLAAVFGDDTRFETTSDGLPGVTRRFGGFWAAAEEAGMSRIYGGIHWQFDNTDGLAGGKKVAEHVLENCLRPYKR